MTGPSDSSVQVEALKRCPFCGGVGRHLEAKAGFYSERVICDECDFYLPPAAWNRRAALPVAHSDHPMRHWDRTCPACNPDAPLPVAALSDADRELMEQAMSALLHFQHRGLLFDYSPPEIKQFNAAIAALRTRLLRHSEGRE